MIVCYYCQKKGHRRSECRKFKSDTAKGIRADKVTTPAQARSPSESKDFLFTAFSSTSTPAVGLQWLLDSGYSAHVTGTREWFTSFVQIPVGEHRILVANKTESCALGRGNVTLEVWDRGRKCISKLLLEDVLNVPACGSKSLRSVSQLRRSRIFVDFPRDGGAALIMDNGLLIDLVEVNGHSILQAVNNKVSGHLGTKGLAVDTGEAAAREAALWHFRLAHLGADC